MDAGGMACANISTLLCQPPLKLNVLSRLVVGGFRGPRRMRQFHFFHPVKKKQ